MAHQCLPERLPAHLHLPQSEAPTLAETSNRRIQPTDAYYLIHSPVQRCRQPIALRLRLRLARHHLLVTMRLLAKLTGMKAKQIMKVITTLTSLPVRHTKTP